MKFGNKYSLNPTEFENHQKYTALCAADSLVTNACTIALQL